MGMGSIGTLVAHTLMCLPNPPPLSLMFHRPEMYDDFQAGGRIIRVINPRSETNDERSGYDVDLAGYNRDQGSVYWRHISDRGWKEKPSHPPVPEETTSLGEVKIYTLIVTVKGPATVMALRSVKHRITAETTVCLMQNGMGQVDELNREVFSEPTTRPTYMLGIVSHGVYLSKQFAAIHNGIGSTALAVVRDLDKFPLPPRSGEPQVTENEKARMYPSDQDLFSNITSRYLLRTLTRSPILVCASFPYLDLLQLQLEKLAVNCVLNPVTALLDIPNGSTVGNVSLAKVSRLLLAEISAVVRGLPELQGIPNVHTRFSAARLETMYLAVARNTARNSSSMREDVRKHKDTEIDYINGYIVRRGEERGLKCVLNYMLMQLVKGRSWETANADGLALPYGVSELVATPQRSPGRKQKRDTPTSLEDRGTARRDQATRLNPIKR